MLVTSPLNKHYARLFPQTRNKMGQNYHPRKEMILMQIHICKYVSEESTHLCIKQVGTPDKVIVFLLPTYCRRNHCSGATDEHHKCSTAAMTVTERLSGQHPNSDL